MENFVQYAPTEIVFGRGTEERAGEEVKKWGGSNVLIVFGSDRVKRNGLLGRVEKSLSDQGISFREFGGVLPNPRLAHAEEGVQKAIIYDVDFILAVGGGSVIDTAKGIAHGTANPETDLWDIWTGKAPLTRSLPVGCVLTFAAAGSEMSDSAVLTNEAVGLKKGINTPLNRPKFSIMNPELAFTAPKYQIVCGVADIMMHTMERYFIPGITCELTDEIAEGLLRTMVKNGAVVSETPDDYDAMAEVMWCSSISHNNLTECGRGKDFSVHKFGMPLSARFDSTHGATLTAVWASWARFQMDGAVERFARYARKVWGVMETDDNKAAEMGIGRTEEFFRSLGLPVTLPELIGRKLTGEEIGEMADMITMGDTIRLSRIHPIGKKEAEKIYGEANK